MAHALVAMSFLVNPACCHLLAAQCFLEIQITAPLISGCWPVGLRMAKFFRSAPEFGGRDGDNVSWYSPSRH